MHDPIFFEGRLLQKSIFTQLAESRGFMFVGVVLLVLPAVCDVCVPHAPFSQPGVGPTSSQLHRGWDLQAASYTGDTNLQAASYTGHRIYKQPATQGIESTSS